MSIRESTALRVSGGIGVLFAVVAWLVRGGPGFHPDVFGQVRAAVYAFGLGTLGALTLLWIVAGRPRPEPEPGPDAPLDLLVRGHR